MCLLCDDEKAYQAYMTYLDEMARQGQGADPDKAMDAAMSVLTSSTTAPDTTLSTHTPSLSVPASNAPRSPFSCDPVDE
jgi:hypothetical protein